MGNVLTIAERNAMPITQRYKGMIVVVQGQGAALSQIFWLPTDNLTNSGWSAIDIDGEVDVLFRDWAPLVGYGKDQVVVHDGMLYRSTIEHTASAVFIDDRLLWQPIGASGGAREYTHVQSVASSQWLVQHNLDIANRAVNVFAVDENNKQIVGQVNTHLSTRNLLVYDFSEPISGQVYISF